MRSKVMSAAKTRISLLWNFMQCRLVQLYKRIREFRCHQHHSRDLLERALSHCTSLHPRGQHSTSYKISLSLPSLLSINIKFEKSFQKTVSILTHFPQVTSPNSQELFPVSAIFEINITFRNLHFFRPQTTVADSFGYIVFVFKIA